MLLGLSWMDQVGMSLYSAGNLSRELCLQLALVSCISCISKVTHHAAGVATVSFQLLGKYCIASFCSSLQRHEGLVGHAAAVDAGKASA